MTIIAVAAVLLFVHTFALYHDTPLVLCLIRPF